MFSHPHGLGEVQRWHHGCGNGSGVVLPRSLMQVSRFNNLVFVFCDRMVAGLLFLVFVFSG